MDKRDIHRINSKIITFIVIWGMIWGGFIGLLVFEGVLEEGGVEAAKTIIVDINGGGNYTKIQYAIDNASAGDTIRVWAGNYSEYLFINNSISLIGNGSSDTEG